MNAASESDPYAVQDGSRIGGTIYPESGYALPSSIPNVAFKESPVQSPASQSYAANSDMQHISQSQATPMLDFARFLSRRELVTTGFTKFDDNPENFRAWESSFLKTNSSQPAKSWIC